MMTSLNSTKAVPLSALFLALGALSSTAYATPPDPLDPASIAVGAFFVNPNVDLGVNTQYGSADSGNLTEHSTTVPRIQGNILLVDSQGLAFDYYGFYRRYSDALNQSFSAGGNSVNVNGNANASVGLDVANMSYKWWFGNSSDVFGLGAGFAYYRAHLTATANAAANVDNLSGSTSGTYNKDTFAPLVQAGWRHAFNHDTRMYLDLSGVERKGGNVTGHIYNAALGAEWYFMKNVGVGAEYSVNRIRISDANDGANLDMKLNGPAVFLKARF
jgi:hypothetical protein